MSAFVIFVVIVVAIGLALGPVRDRYRGRLGRGTRPLRERSPLGSDLGLDADRRRFLGDLRAAADRQARV